MKYKMAANQALKRFSHQIIKEDATSVLIRRLRNILSPCFTTGSLDAIIEAIAQIGLACVKNWSVIQTMIDAMKTFTAKRTPRRWSSRNRSNTFIERGLTSPLPDDHSCACGGFPLSW